MTTMETNDPNEILERIREYHRQIEAGSSNDALGEYVACEFAALDRWLSAGGYLPRAWQR